MAAAAIKATREAFGEALVRLGADPRVVVLGADLNKSTRAELFMKRYPERFFELGVAEHNMIGTAAGLALSGKVAWCSTFACFLTGRFEPIRLSVCYTGAPVRMVGSHAGIGIGEDGYSQMGLEDMALMRTLPGMAVLQPADDLETEQAVEYLMGHDAGPSYLRLTRQKVPRVHADGYRFRFGRLDVVCEGAGAGRPVAILATGGTVAGAVEAGRALGADGVSATVVNVHTVKPLDADGVVEIARRTGHLVTVEDHSVTGGLGSAVAEVLAERAPARLWRIGVREAFGESGTPEELYARHRLDAEGIRAETLAFLRADG